MPKTVIPPVHGYYYPVIRENSSDFMMRMLVFAGPSDKILLESKPDEQPGWADRYPSWFTGQGFQFYQDCLDAWTAELGFKPELGQWEAS